MRNIYRSKVEIAFVVLLLGFCGLEIFLVLSEYWLTGALALLPIFFIAYLYLNTFYEFTGDQKLRVKSGLFFDKEIYVNSIRKIRPVKSIAASPALSHDRIEILYNRYGSLQISPENRTRFIEELKKINPRIIVEFTEQLSMIPPASQRRLRLR